MKDFSVIVLCYNCDKKALKDTLDSIMCQTDSDFEIILADDASKNDCLAIGESYLKEKCSSSYKIKAHQENVGTIQNIYDALEIAEGKYVKCIGAGDLLFDSNTLFKISKFMDKNKCTMCFGKMQAYYCKDNKINFMPLTVPQDVVAHTKNDQSKVSKNIIQNHGWIAGASMFYDTKKFQELLKELIGTVRYCEDLLQVNLLIHGEKISYYPHGVVYYEFGSGISTNSGNGNSSRIKNDHDSFWDMMSEKYSDNKLIKKGKLMHELVYISSFPKKLISLIFKNPSYLVMCLKTKFQKKYYEISEKGMLS